MRKQASDRVAPNRASFSPRRRASAASARRWRTISRRSRSRVSRCPSARGCFARLPRRTSSRHAGRCRTWCASARSSSGRRRTSLRCVGPGTRSPTTAPRSRLAFGSEWLARAASESFYEVNDLIDRHNRWYPVESRLPMDPRRGDYALVNGRDYRLAPLDTDWVLERFPAELSSAAAARSTKASIASRSSPSTSRRTRSPSRSRARAARRRSRRA